MRIDQYLVDQNHFDSRNKAQEALRDGLVLVNGKPPKPSHLVQDTDVIEVQTSRGYVSRSADKLQEALTHFKASLSGEVVLDVGASTGGFTQVALAAGARQVYAVDVGHGQLHPSLRQHPSVVVFEHTNLKTLSSAMFDPAVTTTVVDVSFISTLVHLPLLFQLGHQWFVLIKPQFETEGHGVVRGVVADPAVHEAVLTALRETAARAHKTIQGVLPCRTTGKTGNQEYMVWIR